MVPHGTETPTANLIGVVFELEFCWGEAEEVEMAPEPVTVVDCEVLDVETDCGVVRVEANVDDDVGEVTVVDLLLVEGL